MDCDGVITSLDCDDNDATVYPGAQEITSDGIDQDCNGDDLPSWNGSVAAQMTACTLCHSSSNPLGGFVIGYTEMLNGSHAGSGMPYVTPGDTANLVCMAQIEGTHLTVPNGSGSQMPLGLSMQPSAINEIKLWIEGGAPEN